MKLQCHTLLRRAPLTTFPFNSTSNGTTTTLTLSVFRCHQTHPHQRLRFIPAYTKTGPSPLVDVNNNQVQQQQQQQEQEDLEARVEKIIYRCRFLAIFGVFGSLIGSFLCFIKGSTIVAESFTSYLIDRTKIIQMLIEAIDVYLLGTVMLVFGMGLYELFVSNLGSASSLPDQDPSHRSNLFGLFVLKERPKWLEISTVNELKTKVGHVIVMLLLIGLFDKSKRAVIQTPLDLLCFCASVFLSSSCLFLLSKLNEAK
ncbi:uncharacterized protein LOC130979216 isoform X1 [Arachis stenosperma]|uniref:uncharacterized protein LOC130979216 isoform X1 n=1 Tax=Arachis stenosperma TaxID=217475 RepID=UPI0025AC17F1|nr:uncharacterized protein LOC130979216 isoform X1 [Arachis stenosperma]